MQVKYQTIKASSISFKLIELMRNCLRSYCYECKDVGCDAAAPCQERLDRFVLDCGHAALNVKCSAGTSCQSGFFFILYRSALYIDSSKSEWSEF